MFLEYTSMMEYSSMNIHLVYEFAFVILLHMFDDEIRSVSSVFLILAHCSLVFITQVHM